MGRLRSRVVQAVPPGPRRQLRKVRRAVRRRVGLDRPSASARPARPTPPPPPPEPPVVGVVERITPTQISGWITVRTDTPQVPVTLHLGGIQLSSTYPTPEGALSAMRVTKEDQGPPTAAEAAKRQRVVGTGVTAGRADGRRNVPHGYEDRAFTFQIRGIWWYLRVGNELTVRVKGKPLPIAGHGMYFAATEDGGANLVRLQERIDQGYVLTQTGRVALSKRLDEEWQRRIIDLYDQTRRVVEERFDRDVFIVYGTLLGSVRDGGYIGHDADFDSAFVSSHRTGPEAAEELVDIALALLDAGLEVDMRQRVLHIHDPEDHDYRIDLFHTYFDPEGRLRFPWGIGGSRVYTIDAWQGTELVDFPGGQVLRPKDPEPLVAHIYGDDWRLPKPGFHWSHARTDVADDGVLTLAQRDRVYWSNFYARHANTTGSSFFEEINGTEDIPQAVLDIGCGDGRDACAFADAGRRVLGLDQSEVAIENARSRAAELGCSERAGFEICDVSDADALSAVLREFRQGESEPVLFYSRFFLHSITAEVQDQLLAAIDSVARPGDLLAAEFRTDKDEERAKTFGNHYRRFQNAADFRTSLTERFGFEIVSDLESDGLSPYGDEDPVLYRVVARYVRG